MDIRYIAVICFGVLSLFLCLFSGIFVKKEKVKTYIALKGLANFSYLVLALVCCNLVYYINASSMFLICGLAGFMLSSIIKALPTKTDMFRAFYSYVDSISFALMLISILFLMPLPLIGIIVGVGIFLVLLIVYLVVKKTDDKKEKLAILLLLFASSFFLGTTINLIISSLSLQCILIGGASLIMFISSIVQAFTSVDKNKCHIAKSILLDIGLILLGLSIFII